MTSRSTAPAPEAPPATSWPWIALILRSLISLAILGGSVAAMFIIGKGSPPPRRPDVDTAPLVQVQSVAVHAGGIDFEVDGVVIPFREIEVPAELAGRIAYKSENCQAGHTVQQGELLVRIDPEEYELEVRRIGENVKQARANLKEMEVQIAARTRQILLSEEDQSIKHEEVQRYEQIDDPGVYSKSELDAARLRELQARDAVQTDKDQLELLEASRARLESAIDLGLAQLDRAQLDLARTEIRAPIDGILTREGPEEGGYVQRGDMVAAIQETSQMEIRCSLPMRQMSWLWSTSNSEDERPRSNNAYELPPTPATVRFDMGAAMCVWHGTLSHFDGASVDQQTRMIPCRVVVERPREVEIVGDVDRIVETAPISLLSGMFVNVEIHASPAIELLTVPEKAVQPGNHVWTVTLDAGAQSRQGILSAKLVNVAHAKDDMVLVYAHGSGVKAGDLVVVSPLTAPTEQARVEVTESP